MQVIQWATPSATHIEQLEKKLLHYTGKAISDYGMIQKGDRILVCVSGGKDSLTMLLLLEKLRRRAPLRFELVAFTLDQAQPGWCDRELRAFFERQAIPYVILREDTYSIVKQKIPENKTYCSLCSRLRRGIIYRYAKEQGFTKIALGHHRDDLICTLLMSIFYNGMICSMPPKLLSDDKSHIVIRPLSYCQEKDIAAYAKGRQLPIIPCNLCGSQEHLARKKVKRLIETVSQENPKIPSNMLAALQNLQPSQLMDKDYWDFKGLEKQQEGRNENSYGTHTEGNT